MSSNFYIGSNPIYKQYLGNTYGSVISGESIDSNVISFVNFVGITNTSVISSLDTFVKGLKGDNLWDKMIQIYPMVGDSGTNLTQSFVTNLKDINTYSGSYIGSFNGDLSGFQSVRRSSNDGDVINTNLNPSLVWNTGSEGAHVSIYTNSNPDTVDAWDWGAQDGSSIFSFFIVGRSSSGGNSSKVARLVGTPDASSTSVNTSGSFVASAYWNTPSTGETIIRANGVSIATSGLTTPAITNQISYLGAFNNNGTENEPTNKKYQMLTVGTYLTTSEMDTLSTHIQTFQESIDSALGTLRAV